MKNKILLTFDIEEFDLPLEYNVSIKIEKQLSVSSEGLRKIHQILLEKNILATFFTTAFFAENNQDLIKKLNAEGNEISSHLYYHSDYNPDHIATSKKAIEAIIQSEINGIRIPRLKQTDSKIIENANYNYDSSLNPTFIPGRYNNFFSPTKIYEKSNLTIVPMSVATWFRIPLFWLMFKHLNYRFFLFLCKRSLKKEGFLNLYFHPWEFQNLDDFKIPRYLKKGSGNKMVHKFERLIDDLSKLGDFTTISAYLKSVKP